MSRQSNDIPTLNGIRGLAVLIVFASHASNIFFHGEITGFGAGQLGVMLFFMLSGFLMSHLYLSRPASSSSQWQFAVNRLARIYPMFAFVVVLSFVVNVFHLPLWAYSIRSSKDLARNLTFVQGYDVFWTIGPEVIFYGLFLILWRSWRRSAVTFLSFTALLAVIAWAPVTLPPSNSLFDLQGKLPYFIVGSLLGACSGQLIFSGASHQRSARFAFWSLLVVFVGSFPQIVRLFADVPARLTGNPWPDPWSFPFYLVATSGLFIAAVVARPWILTNRVAGFLGKISFSFYLLHFAVLENMQPVMPTHPLRSIALAFIVTVALAFAAYIFIERPARAAIRRVGPGRLRAPSYAPSLAADPARDSVHVAKVAE